jgi:AbiTii
MTDTAALIEQIQEEALDDQKSLAGVLRKCVALAAQARSDDLVDWATRELRGYFAEGDGPLPDVPGYRVVAAPLVIDGMDGGYKFTQLQISPVELPEPANETVKEEVELRAGVGELEDLLRRARDSDEQIRFGLPGSAAEARLMSATRGHFVERIYWHVSPTAVAGALDQVRTRLVELSSRIKATTRDGGEPTPEAVQNMVNVVLNESAGSTVNVTAAQASGPGPAIVNEPHPAERPWWRRAKTIGAFFVALAVIAGTVAAWLTWWRG